MRIDTDMNVTVHKLYIIIESYTVTLICLNIYNYPLFREFSLLIRIFSIREVDFLGMVVSNALKADSTCKLLNFFSTFSEN